MFGSGSFQLARVFGIRVGVDASWFLILFFFIFVLSGSFKARLDATETVAYATAVASALLFFTSLILHELGHAVVARRLGIGISGIDLWFFGGLAKMQRDADSPGTEFKIAVAGPVVTLLVIVACTLAGIALAGTQGFLAVLDPGGRGRVDPGVLLLAFLASINLALLLFNLVPAYPLDGGRIARAMVWKIGGDRLRATRVAALLGQLFAYAMIGFGLFLLAMGDLTSGLWFAVLGWFLAQAARASVAQTAFSERLGGVTVADIMEREPVAIPAHMPVGRAWDEFFLRYGWDWFPVVDERGHPVGTVSIDSEGVARAVGDRPVSEAMQAVDSPVQQDSTLESLLGTAAMQKVGALLAVDRDGVLRGIVTREQVVRALQSAAGGRG